MFFSDDFMGKISLIFEEQMMSIFTQILLETWKREKFSQLSMRIA
jgi:hypothetical protein